MTRIVTSISRKRARHLGGAQATAEPDDDPNEVLVKAFLACIRDA
jgi:hypothetical protein